MLKVASDTNRHHNPSHLYMKSIIGPLKTDLLTSLENVRLKGFESGNIFVDLGQWLWHSS